jgi:hypothetical protein
LRIVGSAFEPDERVRKGGRREFSPPGPRGGGVGVGMQGKWERSAHTGHTFREDFTMMLTALTLIAAAALGGAVALELTALVVLAGIALAVIGVANGVRTIGRTFELLRH